MNVLINIKQQITILVLIMFNVNVFTQTKEVFLTDNFIPITKEKYITASKDYDMITMRFIMDTLGVNMVAKRVKKGKLLQQSFDSIKHDLSMLSGKSIPKKNTIVINYHHGEDSCNSSGDRSISVRNQYYYLRQIKRMRNVSQFFMYKSHKGLKRYNEKITWIKDKFETIESRFFPVNYPCGSYILINEEGYYYVRRGEHPLWAIKKLLKDKENTFSGEGSEF